jgi:hypothetical protein
MKKITYELKLEKSVKIILAIFAIGVVLNALSSSITYEMFGIKDALAELGHNQILNIHHSGHIGGFL